MSLYRVEMSDGQVCEVALRSEQRSIQAEIGGQTYSLRLVGRCPQRGWIVEIDGQTILLPDDPSDPESVEQQIRGIAVHLPPPSLPKPPAEGWMISSPMAGVILSIPVICGQTVQPGQTLLCLEAMKMENTITCREPSRVESIGVQPGEAVRKGQALLHLLPLVPLNGELG